MGTSIRLKRTATPTYKRSCGMSLRQGYRGIAAEALITGSVDEVAEQFRTFGEIGYIDIPSAPSHQRAAESPRFPGTAGDGARSASLAAV